MQLAGLEPPLRLHQHISIPGERGDMAAAVVGGAHAEPLLPSRLQRRRAFRTGAQPAWADRHQRSRIARGPRRVIDRPGLHLCPLNHQRHRLLPVEQDAPAGNLVAQPRPARLQSGMPALGHHRHSLGLDFHRPQPATHAARSRCSRFPSKHDGQQIADQLIARAAGERAHHIDMVFKGNHIRCDIHAEAAAAAHQHRRGLCCRRGCSRRLTPPLAGQKSSCQPLQAQTDIPVEPDCVDTADVGPLGTGRLARQHPCDHRPTTAGRPTVAKLHHFTGADFHLLQFHIAGLNLDLIVSSGSAGSAPDGHFPAQAAPHQLAEPPLA